MENGLSVQLHKELLFYGQYITLQFGHLLPLNYINKCN